MTDKEKILEKLLTLDVRIRATLLKYVLNVTQPERECILFPIVNKIEEIREDIINMGNYRSYDDSPCVEHFKD